jgi:DNA-binding CsgD family transcriptional regulator/tetratricopeptide (TPR) repeat protein
MALATPPAADQLLERSEQLGALSTILGEVVAGASGRLALVSGEAGVGKTALLRALSAAAPRPRGWLWGACDPLHTPRPLGPMVDISERTGGELARLVSAGARPYEVAAELLRELSRRGPTLVVLEDLHWADEATFDLVRILGRRIETVPALLVLTYRDDELSRDHPWRVVLGDLVGGRPMARIHLSCLSATAVGRLSEPYGIDPDALFRITGGNAFFVTEVLAAGAGRIPESVHDAVLARVVRLSPPARFLLDAVAIAPLSTPLWLLEALTGDAVESLPECVASGSVVVRDGEVSFRHELARLTLEAGIGDRERVALHRKALAALAAAGTNSSDPARLAHHAEAAGDASAVLRYAPEAGAAAARVRAHREAAAQYARALRFSGRLSAAERAELLSRRATECFLNGDYSDAIAARGEAVRCFREAGDFLGEADALQAMAPNLRCYGRVAEANQAMNDALSILETLPPGRELAMTRAIQAMLALNIEDLPTAGRWASMAIELAREVGDHVALVHALNTRGTAACLDGDDDGRLELLRSIDLSRQWELDEQVGRGYLHLTWALTRIRAYDLANRYGREGIEYCLERGLDAWRYEITGHMARRLMDGGSLDSAVEAAASVLRSAHTNAVARTICHSVIAVVRARRGDPDPHTPLEQARAIAEPTGELQQMTPPAAAAAEIAWLEGVPGTATAVVEATDPTLRIAMEHRAVWVLGELGAWRRRVGADPGVAPAATAGPYALELAGESREAAAAWRRLGCDYEAAVVLASARDTDMKREALMEFQRLGAGRAAALTARRLRERGERALPRGPRPSTRRNPALLTARELEVLSLVARRLRNAEIAQRLHLTEKTVDHHLSAILGKLGVRSRTDAAQAASALGIELAS